VLIFVSLSVVRKGSEVSAVRSQNCQPAELHVLPSDQIKTRLVE
jgi:hypothetical protein